MSAGSLRTRPALLKRDRIQLRYSDAAVQATHHYVRALLGSKQRFVRRCHRDFRRHDRATNQTTPRLIVTVDRHRLEMKLSHA